MSTPLPPILPVGTAVVALVEVRGHDGRPTHAKGVAGIIVASPLDPEHSYRVRFPGGDDASLKRREIQVLARYQSEGYALRADPLTEYDLYRHVIYRVVVGSRAYGLDHAGSDTDRRGVYLPPASMHWSVFGVPEQLENDETQECYWELQKFITLALKANPNVLEVLYVPDDCVEVCEGPAARLRAERGIFLSRLVYQTFNGYAMSQFEKLQRDLQVKGAIKNKHAMHLIRLLFSGIHAMTTGELALRVGAERDQLLAIRDGLMPWEEVNAIRLELHRRFEATFASTTLPERPDYERANAILVDARREAADREKHP